MKIRVNVLPVIRRSAAGRSTTLKALPYGGMMTSEPGTDDVIEQGARGPMSGSSAAVTGASASSTCRP